MNTITNLAVAVWTKSMKTAKATRVWKWLTDPIHNGKEGRDLLLYLPQTNVYGYRNMTRGMFLRISPDGTAEGGFFQDAIPNMGDATYLTRWSHKFSNFDEAKNRVEKRL